jgi:hypothetical protein
MLSERNQTTANCSTFASLYPDASHLRLPPDGLPAIRCQSVRWQRLRSLERGFCGYHVQQADVLGHGHRTGRQSAWSFDGGLYSGHLCALLLRRELEGEESIRCQVEWDEIGWFGGQTGPHNDFEMSVLQAH